MRAKFVRGEDPKKSLQVGKHRSGNVEVGEIYKVIVDGEPSGTNLILAKNDEEIISLLDPEWHMKHHPATLENIRELTMEEYKDGKAYDIDPEIDEDIVLWERKDGKLYTYHGQKLEVEQ